MSSHELTPVSYLVLGLIAAGARTSYELKQKVASSLGYMWSFPHSALYAEPGRLVGLGLLEERREDDGRRRRFYTITDDGRLELEAWLREPTAEPPQLRDLGLVKLFFSAQVDEAAVRALARAQESAHRERLAAYEAIAARLPRELADPFPGTTLGMGLRVERAFVAFWSEVALAPPHASRSAAEDPQETCAPRD